MRQVVSSQPFYAPTGKDASTPSSDHQLMDKISKTLAPVILDLMLKEITGSEPLEVQELDREQIQLHPTRSHLDFLARVKLRTEKEVLVHLEFQTTVDQRMHYRMASYCLALLERYQVFPLQIVVYLGKEKASFQTSIQHVSPYGTHCSFNYLFMDLHQLDRKKLLETPNLGKIILALFTLNPKSKNVKEELIRLFASLLEVARAQLKQGEINKNQLINLDEAIFIFEALCRYLGLASLFKEVIRLFDVRIEELPTYQEGMEKGIKEGMEKGIKEGMKKGMEKGKALGAKEELIHSILLFLEKMLHATETDLEKSRQRLSSRSMATLRKLYEELFELKNIDEFWQKLENL